MRYVDDCLAFFNNPSEATSFVNFLNTIHPNISFTIEHEDEFGKIPFLDLLIMKNVKRDGTKELSICVYRKPTHSGVYTHFSSFIPLRLKRNLIWNAFERAYKICSDHELLHRELEDLKRMFMRNGYNEEYVYDVMRKFLDTKYPTVETKREKEGPEQYKIYISLPYLGEASEKIRGNINSCLQKLHYGGVKLVFLSKYTRLLDWFRFKDRQPKHLLSGWYIRYSAHANATISEKQRHVCRPGLTNTTNVVARP